MNRKPERLLNKSRRKYARPSSPKIVGATGRNGWTETIPKADDKLSVRRSRSEIDDIPRLGNLGQKQERHKPMDKPAKLSKGVICGKRRDFGGISDDSSSNSSDESVEEVHKLMNTKHNKLHSNVAALPENSNRKRKTRFSSTSLNEAQGKVIDSGARKQTAPIYTARRDLVKFAKCVAIPEDITSVSHLKWYVMQLGKKRTILQPCWVLSPGEAFEQKQRMEGEFKENTGGRSIMIQYLKFPNVDERMCKFVAEHRLVPLERKSNDGLSLNEHYLERYIKEQSRTSTQKDLEAMRLFIERVFNHAKELQEKAREQSKKDCLDYHGDSSSEECGGNNSSVRVTDDQRVQFDDEADNEKEDLQVPYTQAITFDPDDFVPAEEKSNEPIRQGDVIEYYSPIFVAGDVRGLRQASILSVKPDDETALVLSNGEVLPNNTKVKRIKVLLGDELLDHPGIFRPIYRFKLVKGGCATAADAVTFEAARFGRIMQKNMSKMKEKAESDGFAPLDLLLGLKGAKDDTAAKSVLRSKSSSTVQCCRKRCEPFPSSSSDDSSSYLGQKQARENPSIDFVQEKSMKEHHLAVQSTADNKENNGLSSAKGNRMSLGSLSTLDSLGSSLASSDSSIDSTTLLNMNVGKDDAKMTLSDRFPSNNSRKKSDAKSQNRNATCDLSLLSDDDMCAQEQANAKSKTPENSPLSSELGSFKKNEYSEPSIETPNSLGSMKQLAANPSKRPLVSGAKYQNQSASKKFTFTTAAGLKNCLSSDDDLRDNESRRNIRGHANAGNGILSTKLPRSSSPDSERVTNGGKSNFLSNMNSLPSCDLSSSADSGDDIDTKPLSYSETAPKQLWRGQSMTSLVSTEQYMEPKNQEDAVIEFNSLGWTQGKAGWKKSSPVGQCGLSVCRVKK